MADKVIIVEDEEDGPQPSCSAAAPSSAPQTKKTSPLKAQLPVATHISQSPFTVAKETNAIRAENEKLFTEFVEHCTPLTKDCPDVLAFLQTKHGKACPDFLSSVEFRNTIGRCLTRAQAKLSKTFVYIFELCTVLGQHSVKRRQSLHRLETKAPQAQTNSAHTTSAALKSKDKSSRKTQGEGDERGSPAAAQWTSTSKQRAHTDEDTQGSEPKKEKKASRKQIAYLENLLKVYNEEIARLQRAELSLDDMGADDSTYIQEHKLKRKMMKIYEKLCELKNCRVMTGRVMEQDIPYCGTRYPEINKRIRRFINSPETRSNPPDFADILHQVSHANKRHNLKLSERELETMARDVFSETGSRMQERRHLDLVYNFGSALTDNYAPAMDPALSDPALQRKLRTNREVALSRLDEVISKYAMKQENTKDQEKRKRRSKAVGKPENETVKVNGGAEEEEEEEEEEEQQDEEEDEDDDEDDVSSDPDIEEEIKASTEAGAGEEIDEDEGNEVESAPSGTDGGEQTDDQTGSVFAAEEESVKDEAEPCGISPVSDMSKSHGSPRSDVPSPQDDLGQSKPAQSDEPLPLSNGDASEEQQQADSFSQAEVADVSAAAQDATGHVLLAANGDPFPLSPKIIIEDFGTQTTNGSSPPSSPRMTRSQKRLREATPTLKNSNNMTIQDSDNICVDMSALRDNSLQESKHRDTPTKGACRSPPLKKLKVSVATQCDPEEIIVLSDSE